jgi:hypothetical protein
MSWWKSLTGWHCLHFKCYLWGQNLDTHLFDRNRHKCQTWLQYWMVHVEAGTIKNNLAFYMWLVSDRKVVCIFLQPRFAAKCFLQSGVLLDGVNLFQLFSNEKYSVKMWTSRRDLINSGACANISLDEKTFKKISNFWFTKYSVTL